MTERHVVGLSGGKDSAALAVYVSTHPDYRDLEIQYFFSDTGKELPEEHIGYENKTRTQSFIQAVRIARKVGKIDVDAVVKAYAAVTREVDRTWNDIMTLKAGGELDQWDRSSAGGNQFTERMFTAMIAHAKAEQADELEAEIRFHSSPEVASMPVYTLGKAELTMLKKQREDKGVKSKELKLRVDKKMHRIVAEQAQESSKEKEIVVAPRKVEAIEFSDPEDFAVAMSPPAFKLVDAYEGAKENATL